MSKFLPKYQLIFLQHLADGKSYRQAAEAMGITYGSACNYARKINHNLQTTAIYHAVAEMLREKQIK